MVEDNVEVTTLTPECGHHCGTDMRGKIRFTSHCDCIECHGRFTIVHTKCKCFHCRGSI